MNTKELTADAKAPSGAAKSPSGAIAAILAADDLPPPIRDMIEDKCLEIMMVDMPKTLAIVQAGPVRTTKGMPSLASVYSDAMKSTAATDPEVDKAISATVKDVALDIAERIDAGLKRILLSDEFINTAAHQELMSTHAKLVGLLEAIKLTSEQEDYARENLQPEEAGA